MADGGAFAYLHRGAGIRTRDLLLPKQARYRAAPRPADDRPVQTSTHPTTLPTTSYSLVKNPSISGQLAMASAWPSSIKGMV